MKMIGNVEVPQEAFMAVLRLGDDWKMVTWKMPAFQKLAPFRSFLFS